MILDHVKLETAMARKGYNQRMLARRAKRTPASVSRALIRVQTGQHVTPPVAYWLAQGLGVTIDDLLPSPVAAGCGQ